MKILKMVDVYLKIEPTIDWFKNEEERLVKAKRECEVIKRDLIDHNFVVKRDIIVFEKRKETCSFCGEEWELDREEGYPLCCQKAIDEWEEEKKKEKKD